MPYIPPDSLDNTAGRTLVEAFPRLCSSGGGAGARDPAGHPQQQVRAGTGALFRLLRVGAPLLAVLPGGREPGDHRQAAGIPLSHRMNSTSGTGNAFKRVRATRLNAFPVSGREFIRGLGS